MKSTFKNFVAGNLKIAFATLMFLLLSVAGYSQDPGGGPDGPPPAVPFDDYLLIILAVVGLLVTFFYFRRKDAKRAIN